MYARRGQETPCHAHLQKKEDIVCRAGELLIWLWSSRPESRESTGGMIEVPIDGRPAAVPAGQAVLLKAGQRVTLSPGVWHAFAPASDECIFGEVSTANDDTHDNLSLDPAIGRFPVIDEEEPAIVRLAGEQLPT